MVDPENKINVERAAVSADAIAAGTNAAMAPRLVLRRRGSSAPVTKSATTARNRSGLA